MLTLNFGNVEELLFADRAAQSALPAHWFSVFEQWRLAVRVPYLREIGKGAVLDLLNGLGDDDVAALEDYFGERIIVERLNYSAALNVKVPLAQACEALCAVEGFNYYGAYRDGEYLYITLWR